MAVLRGRQVDVCSLLAIQPSQLGECQASERACLQKSEWRPLTTPILSSQLHILVHTCALIHTCMKTFPCTTPTLFLIFLCLHLHISSHLSTLLPGSIFQSEVFQESKPQEAYSLIFSRIVAQFAELDLSICTGPIKSDSPEAKSKS